MSVGPISSPAEGIRTAPELLERAAVSAPDAVAVRDATGEWTYSELLRESQRITAWLRSRGVTRGDRVLLSLRNGRRLVALIHGVLAAGAVVVPVGVQTRSFQLAAVAADAEPRLAIGETVERFEGVVAPTQGVDVLPLEQVWAESASVPDPAPVAEVAPEDLALLIYTSGSTAGPKGVVSRHRHVAFAVDAIAGQLAYRPGDVVCCRLPLSFDYALYQVFLCAHAGAELAMVDSLDELAAFRAIRDFRATVLPVVPPVAQTLLRLAARGGADIPLRLITNTGAELTRGVADGLRAAFPGVDVVPMYGMTECKRISIAAPNADVQVPGTVGRPLPGTRVDVVGPDGDVLPPGEVGEIVVYGPHVMDGYWRDPAASAERFRTDPVTGDRCLVTGDFGAMDRSGALTIVGRRDDVFKRRGVRTSVSEIETAAIDIPGVEEAAAALVGDARECVLWVRGTLPPEHVLKAISERLEPAKTPDHCIVVDGLPRMPSGKIDKNALKAGVEGNR